MALDGTRLGDAIVTAIAGLTPPSPDDGGTAFLKAYWETIARAIVTEITTNAEILPNTFEVETAIPVSTTGGPTAQAGFTTAPWPLQGEGKVS